MKKNYWDDETGWLNVPQSYRQPQKLKKREVFDFLKRYFHETDA